MALRRSRVRVSLGPPAIALCYNRDNILKVMTGVVDHPVSEKGERGGSPSLRKRERPSPAQV